MKLEQFNQQIPKKQIYQQKQANLNNRLVKK